MPRRVARAVLARFGKGERKVAVVFGYAPEECHAAVQHLRRGAPEIPVWLFSTTQPLPETVSQCERVHVNHNCAGLLLAAEAALWPVWVAIILTTWTGAHGRWAIKLAPFLIPPFRALILNRHGGFFSGTPLNVLVHAFRALRDTAHLGWSRVKAATLAVLWQWFSAPDRCLFNRLHGHETLQLAPTGAGSGILTFRQGRWLWRGPELERLARTCDARWILFQARDDDRISDMLPLFEDERTFAVARQESCREWKPMLFATSPFRALQPGEVSRVLAPISGTVLVDCQKLKALGVPKTRLAVTAWMLLFWKAAAAGWRRYCVANGDKLSEQRVFPFQQKMFILRVLSDARLRRLAPQQPELARGNIAFAPSVPRSDGRGERRLKVLLVSPFLPYPLSHGGAVRIYNLCRALADRVDFILAAMREVAETVNYQKLHEIFREVYAVDRDELPSGGPEWPRQVREHQSSSLRALIGDLTRRLRPDVLQIEYTHMAGFREGAPEAPAVLVEHDLTFSLYRQLAESEPSKRSRREYERWLAFERRWLSAYDAVWTVSEEDREKAVMEGKRREDRTFTVPNGVDTERFAPSPEAAGQEVLFVGSFRHLPNILAFEKLLREVMPRVWTRVPQARLRVVAGPEHERFCRKLAGTSDLLRPDPRVEIHGFVEDLRPLYARSSVVTAPLAVSAGTNIKVLEAMACGKAIVTTPAGCAGLGLQDGSECLIAADWEAFAEAAGRLLSDTALRASLGARARVVAVDRYSWESIADEAYRSYQFTRILRAGAR